jgi:hypothetical protein
MLTLATVPVAAPQKPVSKPNITVSYSVDGHPEKCNGLRVALNIRGELISPSTHENQFVVPDRINKLYDDPQTRNQNNIDIHVVCNGVVFKFPNQYPARVLPGTWEVGIDYPPHWFEQFRRNEIIESGMWLTHLSTECIGCDPGVITSVTHADLPKEMAAQVRRHQSTATGTAARDAAYALAVYGIHYKRNSDYLLSLLQRCLTHLDNSLEDDVCNETLLDELTNLYWRGDKAILDPLLRSAGSKSNAVDELGDFVASLLDRQTRAAIEELAGLPEPQRQAVCRLAGIDEFSLNTPRFKRIAAKLNSVGESISLECLKSAEDGDKDAKAHRAN